MRFLLDDSAHQMDKVLEGINEDIADMRVNEHCMSPRETLIHLLDCGQAFFAHCEGREYAWGSFVPSDPSIVEMRQAYREMRADVKRAVQKGGDDEKTLKNAAAYITSHDFYHVGQMVTFRLTYSPGWDAYSIYPQG